jgi:ADP-heptose:LPS heptosyltransferase
LADLGAVVVLNVQRELLPIMPSLDARIEITDSSSDRVDCDFHAYLMSLAHIFGTEVKTIPAEVPYLSVSPESVSRWGQRLKEAGRPRVGLVISGAASFKNDHNRSIPLSLMAPLLELPLDFHCLQKELRVDDSRVAKRHTNFYQYTNEIETFEDTAALVASMDLVICVDTSVAHLVGAMAKPLWLLVPYTPDNRWFLDRTDSPWYPTAAIYRQNERNNWPAVIGRVRADLIQRFVPHLA